jgi:hypothetical protein
MVGGSVPTVSRSIALYGNVGGVKCLLFVWCLFVHFGSLAFPIFRSTTVSNFGCGAPLRYARCCESFKLSETSTPWQRYELCQLYLYPARLHLAVKTGLETRSWPHPWQIVNCTLCLFTLCLVIHGFQILALSCFRGPSHVGQSFGVIQNGSVYC